MQNNTKPFSLPHFRKLAADLVLLAMFILTAGLYALLMVRDHVPIPGLATLAALGLAHYVLAGWRRSSPLDLPILGLLGLLPLSLAVTIDRGMTLTKVYGALLGVALFYLSAQYVNNHKRLHLALLALVALSLALAGLGLVGTDWASTKVIDLPLVYNQLPRLVESVPRSQDGGIQANLMGGALAFLVPLLVGLLWDRGGFNLSRVWGWQRGSKVLKIIYKLLLGLTLLVVAFTLLLTQSRGGLLGALVGILALAVWKNRRFLWVLPLLLVNILLAWRFLGAESLLGFFTLVDARDGITLPQRADFWERGLRLVQDFPLTGTGIGAYSALVRMFYPFASASPTTSNGLMTHAHNQFITVATDLGLPGLVLYTALLGGFAAMVIRTWPYAGRLVKAVLAGLAGGMLAYQVFGIMDAFMLGSKLAALFWIYLGLGTALYIHRGRIPGPHPAPKRVKQGWWPHIKTSIAFLFQGFAGWVGVSVVAVAIVHTNTILSLALAVIGGLALGVLLVKVYEDVFLEKDETKIKAKS